MVFDNLDRIQQRMSTPSSSEFVVGHGTKRLKINFEDACGALAHIKKDCGETIATVASVYCQVGNHKNYYLHIRFYLHKYVIDRFKADGKEVTDRCLIIADTVMRKVFEQEFISEECIAEQMGIKRSSYAETWRVYVIDAEHELTSLLSQADISAGEYFYHERVDCPA